MTGLLFSLLLLLLLAAPAGADAKIPPGFRVVERATIADGVEHLALVRDTPRLSVHLALVRAGAPVSFRTLLSNDRVAEPPPRLERTSSMCARAACLVAVNGDFWVNEEERPLGALVSAGRMVSSPNPQHHQVLIDSRGRLSTGPLEWTGRLVSSELQEVRLDGINTRRDEQKLVLYTPDHGSSTGTNRFGSELVMRLVEPRGGLSLGQTALFELVELRAEAGDSPIPPEGAVLSGHDRRAEELRRLWTSVGEGKASRRVLLRLDAKGEVVESVGGTPILLRDGKRWFADAPNTFTRDRHPRTLVGSNPAGDVVLAVVDGRQPAHSVGMTLVEAAEFMIGLGMTEAMNLDGGGSSTFVVRGQVVNRPSDRAVRRGRDVRVVHIPSRSDAVVGNVERPVVDALALVAQPRAVDAPADPLGPGLGLPSTVRAPAPNRADPGSIPDAGLPALLQGRRGAPTGSWLMPALVLLNVLLAAALVRARRQARAPAG